MELEKRVESLERRMTKAETKLAIQDVNTKHMAGDVSEIKDILKQLLSFMLTHQSQKPQESQSVPKKNSFSLVDFLAENKKICALAATLTGSGAWLIHHIVFISAT